MMRSNAFHSSTLLSLAVLFSLGACDDPVAPVAPALLPLANDASVESSATGWTIMSTPNPSTSADVLNGVHAISSGDVWAVGYKESSTGTETLVEHLTGGAWSVTPSPNPGPSTQCGNGNVLLDVSASSATNIWAVGYYYSCSLFKPLAIHWNGSRWKAVQTPVPGTTGNNVINAVAATSPSDAWAVGYYEAANGAPTPLIMRFNGTSWTLMTGAQVPGSTSNVLNSVAVLGPNDVWAGGTYYDPATSLIETMIQHWNGSSWTIVPSPSPGTYFANVITQIVALSASNVWAFGYFDEDVTGRVTLIEHWNGSAWSVVPSPNASSTYFSANELNGAVALSANDIWAVGHYRSDATAQQKQTLALHWDGTAWTVTPIPSRGKASNLTSIAQSAGTLWAVGEASPYGNDRYTGEFIIPRTLAMTR
ncbi:MAG TPA: hypothetical protein VHM24_13780 [Gemmatimonadaceae bacterium]|nr:hypothetical protein [Gemmatimonadaceae bacterium]